MAQAAARGSLELVIGDRELEARLDFTPAKDGEEWTADRLLKLVIAAHLSTLNPKKAEDLVSKFSRSRAPVKEVIAEGTAPEEPVSETVEWAELPIPEEYKKIATQALERAEAPVLWRTVGKTIKTEKKVTKPGALPFLPPKVETVIVSERIESRERVYPDPATVATGYAKKGIVVGKIFPSRPGKVGKSVFGKPVPFSGEAESFLIGSGISRVKSDLCTEEDGIVRAGRLWVELMVLSPHQFSVSKSVDGMSILLDYRPGHLELSPPSSDEILAQALKAGGNPSQLLPPEDIDLAIGKAAADGQPLFAFPLTSGRDAEVRVDLVSDGSLARLYISKGRGNGRPLDLSAVTAALKASGLKGFQTEEIKKAVLAFRNDTAADELTHVLLKGKAPTRGKDRSLGMSISPLPKESADVLLARIADHAQVDLHLDQPEEFPLSSATILAFATSGQKLGEVSAHSPGQPGIDIYGKEIPGLAGNDPAIRCFDGATFAKGAVVAARSGLLVAAQLEGVWNFRVLPFLDAHIDIRISRDGMECVLDLQSEEGFGSPLDVESVVKALTARGVSFGIDSRRIAEAVADARAGRPASGRPVARGRPAVPAGGLQVEWILPGIEADGKIPKGLRVAKGQELARIKTSGAGGSQGCDVLGKPLLPSDSSHAAQGPGHDRSIEVRDEGGGVKVLLAALAGELLPGSALSIRDSLEIAGDVRLEDGEVRFAGSVRVGGTVRNGARVFAGGDIHVEGSIEAALVSSEGTVTATGGIKGGRRGTLRAMRAIDLAFAEQALLMAVEDVVIRGHCLLSNVKTNGKVATSGGKSSLVGGLIRARKGVDVGDLGSEKSVKTEVSFGQDYLIADQIESEEVEIEKIKAAIIQADRSMAELERAGAGLDRIRQDKVKLLKLLEKRSMRLFDFREKYEQHCPSEVRVRGVAYPGVILESHGRYLEVHSRKTGVVFSFDQSNGRIVERSL
ncbi:MAG: FapA family protein [Spirochaetota bacterium]